jgi:hypothetical protein
VKQVLCLETKITPTNKQRLFPKPHKFFTYDIEDHSNFDEEESVLLTRMTAINKIIAIGLSLAPSPLGVQGFGVVGPKAHSLFQRQTPTSSSLKMVPEAMDTLHSLLSSTAAIAENSQDAVASSEVQEFGTRNLSYYSTLALYGLSFPGLWSTIKRSTNSKMKKKTYVSPGESSPDGGKELKQQAGEIMAYMKAKNYEVSDAGEVITFRGIVARSASQAYFLTFCTALGLASLALVLQIQFNDLGECESIHIFVRSFLCLLLFLFHF